MLSKSMRYTENGNTFSRHRSTRLQLTVSRTSSTSKLSKELGYEVLPHPSRSPDLLSTNYYFFKHLNNFLQVKCFHNQQMLSQSSLNPATDFYTTVINLFLLGKNTLIVMVPTLMNKDVFEPSYNDLKFMVRNCN